MKVKTIFQRITYRDYYDLYTLLSEKYLSLEKLINASIEYQSKLNKGIILKRLVAWDSIKDNAGLEHLCAKYSISAEEMSEFFIGEIKLLE